MQKSKVSKIITNKKFYNMNMDVSNNFVMVSSIMNGENEKFAIEIPFKKPKKVNSSIELYE